MRKGVLILRDPATIRLQSQSCLVLSHNGFSCRATQRYDGLLLVHFQRDDGEPDMELADLQTILRENEIWDDEICEIKVQG